MGTVTESSDPSAQEFVTGHWKDSISLAKSFVHESQGNAEVPWLLKFVTA